LQIVLARRLFSWKHVGFANDGDAIFEVRNSSTRRLPFLTVGVRGVKLVGGAWLDVSSISPGATALVEHICYKDMMRPEEMECFSEPDPTPETRDRYWEFKRLSRNK